MLDHRKEWNEIHGHEGHPPVRRPLRTVGLAVVLAMTFALPAAAQVFYVDNQSSACSDLGPGTEAQPYCSIVAAAAAHKGPGITIVVKPGVYREMVTVPASGAAGSPYTFQAQGPGVVIDGSDDFGSPGLWVPASGSVWLAAGVTWDPKRVYVDGAPIDTSSEPPATLPVDAYNYVPGQGLYVNIGGDNPGNHAVFVGRRADGFNMSTKSWLVIDGFEITRTEDRGIKIQTGCSNLVIAHNRVSLANSYGIHSVAGVDLLIEGNVVSDCTLHGIGLTAGATGCTVRDNESFRNVTPGVRKANGIYVNGAPGNTFYRNRLHDNQDTGLQIEAGSNNCVSYNNTSWNNGDHGFDHLNTDGTVHVNDVAYGNFKDGFSIEGFATGTKVFNCIAIENGLGTNEFDLWVDPGSASGFVSDYNIFWNSTPRAPVKYINTQYTSLADYQAASGQDAHSLQVNPLFVNPVVGDFHLLTGSPAIDSGSSDAPSWPALDAEGQARVDIPSVPNSGAGATPYGDRGALEYQLGQTPVAALTLTPPGGSSPLEVTADASGSSDPNGTIVAYTFDFGDGTVVGPQSGSSAVHPLLAGTWTVTVTVRDNDGLTATASQSITVLPSIAALLTLIPATGNTPLSVTADASSSVAGPGHTIVSYSFDMGNGATFGPQAGATAEALYTPGVYTVSVTVQNELGETSSTTRSVIVAETGPGPNLVLNPSFENGVIGWLPVSCTLTTVPGGFDGPTTLRATAGSSGQFGIDDNSNWVDSTLATGTRYRFRAWVRAVTGTGSVRLRVREFLSNGHQVAPPRMSEPVTLASTWKLVTMDYVCEGSGHNIDFRILDSPGAAGAVIDIDNVMINIVLGTSTVGVPNGGPARLAPVVFPNPLRDRGSIHFALSNPGPLKVEIFDVAGRRVRTLVDRDDAAAIDYRFALDGRADDGRRLGVGLYLYRVQAPEGTATGRFVIVR